jgi:multiple sugar transport system ATP-binding protein
MVFQSYAVFPHRRVRENIGFGLAMRGMPKPEIDRKLDWAADLLQLTDYLDRYPAQLSGGQRQRVAVARAIVVDADVLLMDEPLSNLDALLRLGFRAELKKLVGELGTTTLYVTHDQVEALSLGDRVAVMRDGVLQQVAPPLEVYEAPTNEFVGGFIGSPPMNFLTGTVHNGHIDLGGASLTAPKVLKSFTGRQVRVGVRAEAVRLVSESSPGAVPARLEVFEPLGSAVLLTTTVAGQQVKVQAAAMFRAEPGEMLWLDLPETRRRWFDPETALALET